MAVQARQSTVANPAHGRATCLCTEGFARPLLEISKPAPFTIGRRMKLSVVVPCYNEEQRLPRTIELIERYLDARGEPYELILVDDGSADETRKVMDEAAARHPAVKIVALPKNRGKGRALAEGVQVSRGETVLVTDADLSTPIDELPKLEAALAKGAGVAIGSRAVRGSRVELAQPIYRVLMGKVFNLIVQAVLLPGIWDTQCGFKLFRGDIARDVFAGLTTDGFGYDPEVLYLAKKKGMRIAEVPVVWRNSAPTKVSAVRSSLDMFRHVLRVRFRK
ncbi:MAG: glycosyltransferase family 2 protein [Chloroflexi bacterium]|nr:MAG: glycosyltransferase family 2 protein [Chloroflexota bacterium]